MGRRAPIPDRLDVRDEVVPGGEEATELALGELEEHRRKRLRDRFEVAPEMRDAYGQRIVGAAAPA